MTKRRHVQVALAEVVLAAALGLQCGPIWRSVAGRQ
jgi:hypothetical protein